MPIKRAGPFATTTNPYVDAPETPTFSLFPVNCAKDNATTWPWRAVTGKFAGEDIPVEENFTILLETGSIDLATDPSGIIDSRLELRVYFAYQATQEWTFGNTEYKVDLGDPSQLPLSQSFRIRVDGTEIYSEEIEDGVFEADNFDDVKFPPSVAPALVEIQLVVSFPPEGTVPSIKISLAEN